MVDREPLASLIGAEISRISVCNYTDKMCFKLYSFCLVFIMVADSQEWLREKALFTIMICFSCFLYYR